MLGLGPNHKGWGPITRVGAKTPGLGPKRQGWGPIARVGHVQKNIVFRYKIQWPSAKMAGSFFPSPAPPDNFLNFLGGSIISY